MHYTLEVLQVIPKSSRQALSPESKSSYLDWSERGLQLCLSLGSLGQGGEAIKKAGEQSIT